MDFRAFTHSLDGIDWHVEQRGVGAHVVLIPSGEGDCASFDAVAAMLAADFTVTTFDTPGFSRSRVSDPTLISAAALASQVAALLGSLGVTRATVYGCSSGGIAALDLAVRYAELVDAAVVHEVALIDPNAANSPLQALMAMDDAAITATCAALYAGLMNESRAVWEALGPDYHARLAGNYVTWVRRYLGGPPPPPIAPATLAGRPIHWTIGGLTEVMHFFSNVVLAHQAGIALGMLPCKHFPQVSIPAMLADHIRTSAIRAENRNSGR